MWRTVRLELSDSSDFGECAINVAHPWVYGLGNKTENGNYLSPVNAIEYLVKKIASDADYTEVIAFLVTGDSQNAFTDEMKSVAEVIPFPVLKQAARLSESSANLAAEKMQIPAALSSESSISSLSVSSIRTVMNAKAVKDSQDEASANHTLEGLKNVLSGFDAKRSEMLSSISEESDQLKSKSVLVWAFNSEGSPATIAENMRKAIPTADSVHSLIIMMSGADLTGARGMIHEYESNAGT